MGRHRKSREGKANPCKIIHVTECESSSSSTKNSTERERERERERETETETEEYEYLYIFTPRYLYKINVTDEAGGLEAVVDFAHLKLPVFMAPLILDSKFYMVGGETRHPPYTCSPVVSCSSDGLNHNVYVLDPNKNTISVTDEFPAPIHGKTDPKVFFIAGKVYLLASYSFNYRTPEVLFECCDLYSSRKEWKSLPNPPFSDDGTEMRITNCGAFGRNIHVCTLATFGKSFNFNVDDQKWSEHPVWVRYCSILPNRNSFCFVEQPNRDGLAVGYTYYTGLEAFHLAPNGTVRRHQNLSKLYSATGFPPAEENEYQCPIGQVYHLREDKFCLLLLLIPFSLLLATFQVKMKTNVQDGEQDDFLDSHLLSTRKYSKRRSQLLDIPIIQHAFCMLDRHKKHHSDSGELDLSLKEPSLVG